MKCHHPDVFCAALLNSQPMGFYAPAQVVRDAREHGVPVRPVDVNHSRWDCTLENADGPLLGVRLGLRMVGGLQGEHAAELVAARGEHPYADLDDLWRRAGVPVAALERLAEADALASLGLDRRGALWAIRGLADAPLPLFAAADNRPEIVEPPVVLDPMRPGREVVEDYGSTGLSLRAHPLAFLRAELRRRGMVACGDLAHLRDGRRVVVPGPGAGAAEARQRQGGHVHHDRGRDRGGQPDPVAQRVRPATAPGAVRHHHRLPRQGAEGGRGDPRDRGPAGGPVGLVAERGGAGWSLAAAARAGGRGDSSGGAGQGGAGARGCGTSMRRKAAKGSRCRRGTFVEGTGAGGTWKVTMAARPVWTEKRACCPE